VKIALTSDVHSDTGTLVPISPQDDPVDLYVMAGDIGDPYKIKKKIDNGTYGYEKIAYIPGNHEYYKHDFDVVNVDIFDGEGSCYNRDTIEVNGYKVHLATLWTDLTLPHHRNLYDLYLNDVRWIADWNSGRALDEYLTTMEWLRDVVREGDLVFTHHSPSFKGVVQQFIGDQLNCCFHSNLDEFIREKKPALWGHGHIHNPVDYMIGDTRVVANPYGYRHERAVMDRMNGPYELKVIEI